MSNIYLFGICVLMGTSALAQQPPQYSQFVFNNYLINPAAGGTNDY
ncbi:MAG: type IX secretion system membrane protein PorP/SprF, partial [Flavobacteriales bacterium]|nr:type IX secretion system membrane protein PorP/SprF [Flavobacteriales bacterium]